MSWYWPPPSGNTVVNRPGASVVRCREIWVSSEVAWTTAPASGWLSGPVTVAVMMSVVAPTCAVALRGATATTRRLRLQISGRPAATRAYRLEKAFWYTRAVGSMLMDRRVVSLRRAVSRPQLTGVPYAHAHRVQRRRIGRMMLGLRTVIYPVPDLERAKPWYTKPFGVEPYFEEPCYVGFNVGGYELGLDPDTKGVAPGAGGAVAYWGVPDVDTAGRHFTAAGATLKAPAQDVGCDIRVATLADPFGNLVGVSENPHFAAV